MVKRLAASGLMAVATLALVVGSGCGPSTDLTGSPIPNTAPDTRVTARPPDVLEAGFLVQLYWSGFDTDGRVVGYHWKMSNNGIDGISVQDTLTFDPVTGDTLNPWHFTTSTDSVFLVSADIPDFPNDPEGVNRSYQTHTFLVRAIDEDGAVDDTPAYVSFNSTTLLPTVRITGPGSVAGATEAPGLPSTVTFFYEGSDPDYVTGQPVEVRYLWRSAWVPLPEDNPVGYVTSPRSYLTDLDSSEEVFLARDYLVDFADSLWTEWQPYGQEADARRITLPNQERLDDEGRTKHYIFAMQARDITGAVSIDRVYGREVANVKISNSLAPSLTVKERFLGEQRFTGIRGLWSEQSDVAGGQQLTFSWTASAEGYGGTVESYRYGWDLADPDDPNDPNWALQPGTTFAHRNPAPISFNSGSHVLTIEVRDDSDQITRATVPVSVVPIPDPANQFPLLLVDEIDDEGSGAWGGYDEETFRDDFWIGPEGVLTGPGGVAGWDVDAFTIDTFVDEAKLQLREIVNYRATVWTSRFSSTGGVIQSQFRPVGIDGAVDTEKFVWLVPYLESVGNLLYVGEQALTSYVAPAAYEVPIVFESREGLRGGYQRISETVNGRRGFGNRELPDGTIVRAGLSLFPFATLGVSVVDVMSMNSYYEYGTGQPLRPARRRASCVGLKGLTMDPSFRLKYSTAGVLADTIWTDQTIDGADNPFGVNGDALDYNYGWGTDEFYNTDAVGRGTPFTIQAGPVWGCGDSEADLCVEPMLRSYARFDWVKLRRQEVDPSDTWPTGYYGGPGQDSLTSLCGTRALNSTGQAITHDRPVAFLTNKTVAAKPSRVGDVVFGFDPYRFDHDEMTRVIRWVLGEHFGLDMEAGGK